MGDNQASLPGFPSPRKRSDGDDGDEEARATQARLKVVDRAQQQLRTVEVERLIPEDHPAVRSGSSWVGWISAGTRIKSARSRVAPAGLRLIRSYW